MVAPFPTIFRKTVDEGIQTIAEASVCVPASIVTSANADSLLMSSACCTVAHALLESAAHAVSSPPVETDVASNTLLGHEVLMSFTQSQSRSDAASKSPPQ